MASKRHGRFALVLSLLFGVLSMGSPHPASATPPVEVYRGLTVNGRWRTIATSANGEVAVVGRDSTPSGSKLRLTSNRGTNWFEIASSAVQQWTSVDLSADGQIIVASGFLGSTSTVQRSTDQGQTWSTLLSSTTDIYPYVSMSADGQKIVVTGGTVGQLSLLVSTNGGGTWTTTGTPSGWNSVAVSGNGNTMYAANRGELRKSTDNGATWTTLTNAGVHNFTSVSTSNDGSVVLGVVSYEQPTVGAFVSRDGGATFQPAAGVGATFGNHLATGAVSGDGSTLIAASYDSVPRRSVDGGSTWSASPFGQYGWLSFSLSDNGGIIHAAAEASGVWTMRPVPAPTITGSSRTSVSSLGGQSLDIVGTSFVNVQSVTYGGQPVQYTVVATTAVVFETTPVTTSSVTIVVTTAAGAATFSLPVYVPIVPSVDSVSPASGSWRGGTMVTLNGANLGDATRVEVGGVVADIDSVTDNRLDFLTPPGRVGLADIRVVAPVGSTTEVRGFRYTWNRLSVLPAWQKLDPVNSIPDSVGASAEGPNGWLYLGGRFENVGNPAGDVVVAWDGTAWRNLGDDGSGSIAPDGALDSYGDVYDMVFDSSGRLYVAGNLSLSSGATNGVLMWNGSTWASLGSGVDGDVYSMAFDASGNLVVVGVFTLSSGGNVVNLARWNGSTWSAIPISSAGWFYKVAVDGNDIFVAGDFDDLDGVAEADNVARWDGTSWHGLGSDGSRDGYLDQDVFGLSIEGSGPSRRVLAGVCANGRSHGLYAFEAGQWSAVSSTELDGCVVDIERLDDGRLLVAGYIDGVDDPLISGMAVLEGGRWAPGGQQGGVSSVLEFGSPSRLLATSYNQPNIFGVPDYVAVTSGLELSIDSSATSIEPSSGPVQGGTTVTIRGTGFNASTDVTFGDLPATSVTLVSPTEIRAVAPAQGPLTVVVSVYDRARLSEVPTTYRYGSTTVIPDPTPTSLPATGASDDTRKMLSFLGATALVVGATLTSRRRRHVRRRQY